MDCEEVRGHELPMCVRSLRKCVLSARYSSRRFALGSLSRNDHEAGSEWMAFTHPSFISDHGQFGILYEQYHEC